MIRKLTSIFRRLIKKGNTNKNNQRLNKNEQQNQSNVRLTIGFWISDVEDYWLKNNRGFLIYFHNWNEMRVFERVSKWVMVLSQILSVYRETYSTYFEGLLPQHYRYVIYKEEFEYDGHKYKLSFEDTAYRFSNRAHCVGQYITIEIRDTTPLIRVMKDDERVTITVYDSNLELTKVLNIFEKGMEALFRLQNIKPEKAFVMIKLPLLLLSTLEDKYDKIVISNEILRIELDIPISKVIRLLEMYVKRDEVLGIHIRGLDTKQLLIEFIVDYEKHKDIIQEFDDIKNYLGNNVIIKYRYGAIR